MKNIQFDFHGKNFLVTGASSGMGKTVVKQLSEAGACVLALARNLEKLQILHQSNNNISICSSDVCDYPSMQSAVQKFVNEHGRIDGVVHAAGISAGTPLRLYDEQTAKSIMDTSFWAGIKLVQIVSKKRYSNRGCSFILFSSAAAHCGASGIFAYSAAKAAVLNAVKSLAKELGKNQNRINSISPGCVHTEMVKKEMEAGMDYSSIEKHHILGLGEPEDVSAMVLFLLSEEAHWITGSDFIIDGGYMVGDN